MTPTRLILISLDGLAGFYWDDPAARMPTLRSLAARGALARSVESVFPSTTWPSHATIVTGVRAHRHGVVANSILNRATGQAEDLTGDPIYDASALYRTPTLWDIARAAGLSTAALDWPGTRHAATLGFNLPFFKDQRVFEAHTARAVLEELAACGFPVGRMGEWAELPKRFLKDAMLADLAAHVFVRHRPELLLVHFLSTDSFQHLWGPRSPEAYWAIEYVDERLARLLARLPEGEVPDRTALVLLSDHGFLPVEREIRPNVRLRELGLVDVDDAGGVRAARARFVPNGGGGLLYVLGHHDRAGLARELAVELGRLDGVASAWTEEAFPALGLPTPAANPRLGDAAFEADPGYMFVSEAGDADPIGPTRRYRGAHGHLPSRQENRAFLLAVGPGIRPGVELGPIATVDIAPTLARLLGLSLPHAEGRILTELLAEE